MRGHYHCLRSGCYFVTNITTKLPWHIKKHEKAERRAANGFKYFTKREECGRLGTEGRGGGGGAGVTAEGRTVFLAPGGLGHLAGTYFLSPVHQAPCSVFVCLFGFLGPHPGHMEVPRLGAELELQLPAYTTASRLHVF